MTRIMVSYRRIFKQGKILNQFAHEYWYEEMTRAGFRGINHEVPLPDARLIAAPGLDPPSLTISAPKNGGKPCGPAKAWDLRSEVFALRRAVSRCNT